VSVSKLTGRRIRRVLWLSLAALSVFTMAAGGAVAHLLPGRVALWRPASVTAGHLTPAGPVLGPAGDPASGQAATSAGISAAVSGLLSSATLGQHVGALVTDLSTGQVLFSSQPDAGFAPASTAKLTTAVAALDVLGPDARLTTRVVAGPVVGGTAAAGTGPTPITLVGGGDPTLAAGSPPATDYPQPATLVSLAASTARALRAKGVQTVTLAYDTGLFSGPEMGPGWTQGYIATGNVTPIEPLEVDQGRLTAGGAPDDVDGAGVRRSTTPAADAARAFASFLGSDGITVSGPPAAQPAPAGNAVLASVSSPPLAQIVGQMLAESNNVIAENLARQVAIATGQPASFAGGAAAVTTVLGKLGVHGGFSLLDGSGLSPQDQISPSVLIQLIHMAAAPGEPALRPVITGLPVAGFSGTLGPGGSVFGALGQPALGVVRAKTGNLSTVAALAGVAYARNGQLLSFAFMADQLPANGLVPGADQLTRLATALAACGCR
jgi:D-alanyl-D-alanine carboxypeptidase/D-alanyl-D-alanine-endopeptidase (penicillin-binding protein 4)